MVRRASHRGDKGGRVEAHGVFGDDGTFVAWAEVRRVSLVVERRLGVPAPPPRWAFVVEGDSGGVVGIGSGRTHELLAEAHRLPCFDERAARRALAEGRSVTLTLFGEASAAEQRRGRPWRRLTG